MANVSGEWTSTAFFRYLFDNVDADVIVFEDMDRFDANRIFERLREVNTLTNLQRKEDGKKVIRFFYLLRDDIFVSKDRTKFFDYINSRSTIGCWACNGLNRLLLCV